MRCLIDHWFGKEKQSWSIFQQSFSQKAYEMHSFSSWASFHWVQQSKENQLALSSGTEIAAVQNRSSFSQAVGHTLPWPGWGHCLCCIQCWKLLKGIPKTIRNGPKLQILTQTWCFHTGLQPMLYCGQWQGYRTTAVFRERKDSSEIRVLT